MGQGSPTSFQRKHAPDVIRGRKPCLDRRKARSYSQPPRHCHSPVWPEGDGERIGRPPKHHRSGPIRAAGHGSDIAEASKAPVCRAGGRQTRPWNKKRPGSGRISPTNDNDRNTRFLPPFNPIKRHCGKERARPRPASATSGAHIRRLAGAPPIRTAPHGGTTRVL